MRQQLKLDLHLVAVGRNGADGPSDETRAVPAGRWDGAARRDAEEAYVCEWGFAPGVGSVEHDVQAGTPDRNPEETAYACDWGPAPPDRGVEIDLREVPVCRDWKTAEVVLRVPEG